MNWVEILRCAVSGAASDIYILPGSPIMMRAKGELMPVAGVQAGKMRPEDTKSLITAIYDAADNRDINHLFETGDDDFSFSVPSVCRFRCNAYKQRGSLAAVLRVVLFGLPDAREMRIPEAVVSLAQQKNGMVLVTGPAGSGKSTTLACIIDWINEHQDAHIITIEDPIEFLHAHKRSIISQREVANDTESFAFALRAALRQAPDVILVGEMRDLETVSTALTAAETGHLLFSSLHTVGAAKTIDRIVDVFPANQQQQVRVQLSMVLRAVVSQQLIPCTHGGMVPAFEIMIATNAIRNMIREGKVFQIDNAIYAGADQGMRTMDSDILRLYKEGSISFENALLYASNPDMLRHKL